MHMRLVFFSLLLFSFSLQAQDLVKYNPMKAELKGGAENLEQILQTQLTLPKNNQNKYWQDEITVYFLLDSAGHARSLMFKGGSGPAIQKELARLFHFFTFVRADKDPELPYFMVFTLSGEKYFSYQKQQQKPLKITQPADSSFTVYTRADRSPEYYKNGEDGLKDMLMTELEYPPLALNKSVEGTVVIEFVVETNGYITGLTIKQGVGAGCNEEAIRLIKKTRWQPAQANGKLVRYRMSYPITFGLRNVTRDSGF